MQLFAKNDWGLFAQFIWMFTNIMLFLFRCRDLKMENVMLDEKRKNIKIIGEWDII